MFIYPSSLPFINCVAVIILLFVFLLLQFKFLNLFDFILPYNLSFISLFCFLNLFFGTIKAG